MYQAEEISDSMIGMDETLNQYFYPKPCAQNNNNNKPLVSSLHSESKIQT